MIQTFSKLFHTSAYWQKKNIDQACLIDANLCSCLEYDDTSDAFDWTECPRPLNEEVTSRIECYDGYTRRSIDGKLEVVILIF